MTRRSKRDLDRRLDALEPSHPDEERIFVVRIGGDPETPSGWMSPAEYDRYYGPEGEFTSDSGLTIEPPATSTWHDGSAPRGLQDRR